MKGVQGQTLLARLLRQRRGERLTQCQRDLLGCHQDPPWIMRCQTGRLLQSGHSFLPGRDGGGAILGGNPGEIIPIGGDPRQDAVITPVRIEGEQLLHQDRRRPAIHQDVMVGEHKPMLMGREPDQRAAQERRGGEIEALGTILRQDAGQALRAGRFVQQRQIDAVAGRLSLRHDDLHWPAEVGMLEVGAQARMARQQSPQPPF